VTDIHLDGIDSTRPTILNCQLIDAGNIDLLGAVASHHVIDSVRPVSVEGWRIAALVLLGHRPLKGIVSQGLSSHGQVVSSLPFIDSTPLGQETGTQKS
jgi:hypothetical protein